MGLTSAGGHTDQSELLSLCIGHHEDWSAGTGLAQLPPQNACRQLPGRAASKKIREATAPGKGPPYPVPGRGMWTAEMWLRAQLGQEEAKGSPTAEGHVQPSSSPRTLPILQSDQGPMEGSPAGRLCGTHSARTGRLRVSRETAKGTDRGWLQARCLRPQEKGGKRLTR